MKVNVADINGIKLNQSFYITNHSDTLKGSISMINDMVDSDNTIKVYGKFDTNPLTESLIIGQQLFVQIVRE